MKTQDVTLVEVSRNDNDAGWTIEASTIDGTPFSTTQTNDTPSVSKLKREFPNAYIEFLDDVLDPRD